MNALKATLVTLALALAGGPTTRADVTITWNTYDASGFDVTIGGSGSFFSWGGTTYAGWMGTTTSPNGLWELFTVNKFNYPVSFGGVGAYLNIYNHGEMTYHGQILGLSDPMAYTQGYDDFLSSFTVPVQDGTAWVMGDSVFPYNHLWNGVCPIEITSIPDLNDLSTWTWTARYVGTVVPEPGTAALALLGGGAAAAAIQRRLRSSRSASSH